MSVTLNHDGRTVSHIEPVMQRVPWTICPGAAAQLQRTFTGVALADFAARGEKRENCTHLHDLAILAAAHAFDGAPLVYDILVSDPIAGRRRAEMRRNGATMLAWSDEKNCIVEPAELDVARSSVLVVRPFELVPQLQQLARSRPRLDAARVTATANALLGSNAPAPGTEVRR